MNIAGVVINTMPDYEPLLEQQLGAMPGVEVHAVTDNRRMVVTVEAEDTRVLADILTGFHNMKGVISATTVYHHFEEYDKETPDEIKQA